MKDYSIIRPDPTFKCNLMSFGFQCAEGWYTLIYDLLDKLQAIADNGHPDLEVTEIKEKFGELRVYVNIYTDEIEKLIDSYTNKSRHICELCGKPGKLRNTGGWWQTLCNSCFKKMKNNK